MCKGNSHFSTTDSTAQTKTSEGRKIQLKAFENEAS